MRGKKRIGKDMSRNLVQHKAHNNFSLNPIKDNLLKPRIVILKIES